MTIPRIHDIIREVIETTPGLTQKGLAQRMGLNPAAVNRMLYGQRGIKAEEIPIIEEYLGIRLDLQYPQSARPASPAPAPRRGFGEGEAQAFDAPMPVPVYGYAAGSEDIGKKDSGLNLANGEIIDYVRHPAFSNPRNVFAIYVFSDSMEPRYFRGEVIYVHQTRPAEANRDCIIRMKNGDAYVKQLVRLGDKMIRVRQFNPPGEKDIPLLEVEAVYPVIGRG